MALSIFAGLRNAWEYAFGVNPTVEPLRVDIGNGSAGVGNVTVVIPYITLADGTLLAQPISTNAPITIGIGTAMETVTPTAVTYGGAAAGSGYDTCTITATFTYVHGIGDIVSTGTYGLAEAVAAAHAKGGLVAVEGNWSLAGGTTSTITGTKGYTNVTVLDWRGTSGAVSYKAASNLANMAATTNVLY